MNIFDAIRGRRAVREYQSAPVSPNLLEALVDAAVQAPNGMNRQAWHFSAVRDAALLNDISDRAKAALLASLPENPQLETLRPMLADPAFHIFYGAPVLIIISATAPDDMAAYDCCLAAQNLMLAAHANRLGTCWIGMAQSWLRSPEGKARLNLPEGLLPVAPIIVGHPKAQPQSPGRKRARIAWIAPGE